jgi:hypothetical protein
VIRCTFSNPARPASCEPRPSLPSFSFISFASPSCSSWREEEEFEAFAAGFAGEEGASEFRSQSPVEKDEGSGSGAAAAAGVGGGGEPSRRPLRHPPSRWLVRSSSPLLHSASCTHVLFLRFPSVSTTPRRLRSSINTRSFADDHE